MARNSFLVLNLTKIVEILSLLNIFFVKACTPPEQFEKYQIIPDVLDKAPIYKVEVTYPTGVAVNLGNAVSPAEVSSQPNLEWESKSSLYYTVIMIDPDSPSRKDPKFREWNHWLVVNIPGNDIEMGNILIEYIPPGPPKGTGLHRYIILIFKQISKIDFDEPLISRRNVSGRSHFSTRDFIQKYELKGPVAGNFYQAQYDDYVPLLYKEFDI